MKKQIKISFFYTLFFTALLGIVYPLFSANIGGYLFSSPRPSILFQPQEGGQWFHGRPLEEIRYTSTEENKNVVHQWYFGASNLSLTNPTLWKQVETRARLFHNSSGKGYIPSELLFTSASGYDPNISVAGALRQIPKISRMRDLDASVLKNLIDQNTQFKLFGFIGTEMVNVIVLNQRLANPPRSFSP